MAESEKPSNLLETLKPFYQRASEAEDRLSRIEASLANKKDVETHSDAGNEKLLKTISELQSKLEDAKAENLLEREKARKLTVENAKLQYRIKHLVWALDEADQKLESN